MIDAAPPPLGYPSKSPLSPCIFTGWNQCLYYFKLTNLSPKVDSVVGWLPENPE